MYDQHTWGFCQQSSLEDVHFLTAAAASVITDLFTFDHLLPRVSDGLQVFDGQRHSELILKSVLDFTALGANELGARLVAEDGSDQVLSFSLFQALFQSIHQNTDELLGIFLLNNICRLTFEVLEGKVEALSEEVVGLPKFKISHGVLPLMQNIVINNVTLISLRVLFNTIVSGK